MPNRRTNAIPARLAEARHSVGLTQEQVAERAGLSATSITRYETGTVSPSPVALHMLALLYDKSVVWLSGEEKNQETPTARNAAPPPQPSEIPADGQGFTDLVERIRAGLREDFAPLLASAGALTEVVTEARARYGDQGDPHPTSEAKVVPMTQYMKPTFASYARAAAGPDEPVFDEATELRYAFHKSLFPKWAQEKHLLCIEAVGNSMEPTLHEGDLIVLDRSKIEPISGQIFVVRTPDGLVVKRLKRAGRTWRLVSDNPAYPPRSVGKDDRVLGRVAWSGPQPAGG